MVEVSWEISICIHIFIYIKRTILIFTDTSFLIVDECLSVGIRNIEYPCKETLFGNWRVI